MKLYKEASEKEINMVLESSKNQVLKVFNSREEEFLILHEKESYEASIVVASTSMRFGFKHLLQDYRVACVAKKMMQLGEKVYIEIK